jgi:hypothetical protein
MSGHGGDEFLKFNDQVIIIAPSPPRSRHRRRSAAMTWRTPWSRCTSRSGVASALLVPLTRFF